MDDIAALAADFARAGQRAKGALSEVVIDTGDKIVATGKELAPVASGDTRDSIGLWRSRSDRPAQAGDLDVEAGPTTWYAHFKERGTVKMAPQPYMGPAFDRHVEGFVSGLLDVASDDLLW
jgi:HK97 gp10 family phage protein